MCPGKLICPFDALTPRPQPLPPNSPAGEVRRNGLFSALPCLSDSFSPQSMVRVASCSLGTLFPVMSSGSLLASGLLTPCKNALFLTTPTPLTLPTLAMILDIDWLWWGRLLSTQQTCWTEKASGSALDSRTLTTFPRKRGDAQRPRFGAMDPAYAGEGCWRSNGQVRE